MKIHHKNLISGAVTLLLLLSGCGGEESLTTEQTSNVISETFLSAQYDFAQRHDIPLLQNSEQEKLAEWYGEHAADLENGLESMLYLETRGLHDERYEITNRETGYYYIGELEDNEPEGYGMILRWDPLKSGATGETELALIYLGEFHQGQYDGYGLLFDGSAIDKGGYGPIDAIRQYVTQDTQSELFDQWYQSGINYVQYDGTFQDGEKDGEGNSYFISLLDLSTYSEDPQAAFDEGPSYSINIGDYKDGELDGEVLQYAGGYLYYDGEMKSGERSGSGKEYYLGSTNLLYDGEFKDGDYHGNGTMYAEDGSVIYEGKWKYGDYA